jgi:hypothetical protein
VATTTRATEVGPTPPGLKPLGEFPRRRPGEDPHRLVLRPIEERTVLGDDSFETADLREDRQSLPELSPRDQHQPAARLLETSLGRIGRRLDAALPGDRPVTIGR